MNDRNIEVREARPEDGRRLAEVQQDACLVTYPNEALGITREDIEHRFADMDARALKWENAVRDLDEDRDFVVAD